MSFKELTQEIYVCEPQTLRKSLTMIKDLSALVYAVVASRGYVNETETETVGATPRSRRQADRRHITSLQAIWPLAAGAVRP